MTLLQIQNSTDLHLCCYLQMRSSGYLLLVQKSRR